MCQGSSYHCESFVLFHLKTFGGWLGVRHVLVKFGMLSLRWDFRRKSPWKWYRSWIPCLDAPQPPTRSLLTCLNISYIESRTKARWIDAIAVTYAWIGGYLLAHLYDLRQGYWKIRHFSRESFLFTDSCGLFCNKSFLYLKKKKI